MRRFISLIFRNKAGFVGFLGLLFYLLVITVGQWLVPFDDVVKISQINSPPGARLVLMTKPENKDKYKTLKDLAGKTVGYIDKGSGGPFLEPYSESLTAKKFRFSSGRGAIKALKALDKGQIDALVIFSKTVDKFLNHPNSRYYQKDYIDLTISNSKLGPPLIFGTDTQGRDIFSHMVNGGRILIGTAILAAFISTLIAFFLGTISALLGGWFDRMIVALANFIIVLPRFPILIVLASLFVINKWYILSLIIASLHWPILTRMIRSQVLSLREREYVEAAVALDLSKAHIVFKEILPNMMSFVVINFITGIKVAMYDQVGLIFLGMASISTYTWAVMLYFGRSRGALFNEDTIMMGLLPIIAISLFQISLILFSRTMEELFDPRLRGK